MNYMFDSFLEQEELGLFPQITEKPKDPYPTVNFNEKKFKDVKYFKCF